MEGPELIGRNSSFANTNRLSDRTINQINECMVKRKYTKDTFLFLEQEKSNGLFYILEGLIKMTKTTEEGKELVLYVFQKGDLFGELGISAETKHRFNAKIAEDSLVGIISYQDIEEMISKNGETALEFFRWMGLMNQLLHSKLRDLMLYGKNGALCSTLIRLSHSYGRPELEGILVHKKITNSDLADLIGTSRETTNRLLSSLKKKRVIDYNKQGEIIIIDLDYLKQQCHCEECPVDVCRI